MGRPTVSINTRRNTSARSLGTGVPAMTTPPAAAGATAPSVVDATEASMPGDTRSPTGISVNPQPSDRTAAHRYLGPGARYERNSTHSPLGLGRGDQQPLSGRGQRLVMVPRSRGPSRLPFRRGQPYPRAR